MLVKGSPNILRCRPTLFIRFVVFCCPLVFIHIIEAIEAIVILVTRKDMVNAGRNPTQLLNKTKLHKI